MPSSRLKNVEVINARQLVAFNIRSLRRQRGWDQPTLCRRLTENGLPWSTTALSAAEATWAGKSGRQRHLTAAELVTLALTFEVPVARLFKFPDETPTGEHTSRVELEMQVGNDDSAVRLTRAQIELLFGQPSVPERDLPDLLVGNQRVEVKGTRTTSDEELRSALVFLFEQFKPLLTEGGEEPTTKENQ